MEQPRQSVIDQALRIAAESPCRSRRGVVVYATSCGEPMIEGAAHNGPPRSAPCPGREVCAGTCGQRCVHAEVRAIRAAGWPRYGGPSELVHVELAADGGVVACSGPTCPGCAAQILDVGFVGGVWLYEMSDWLGVRIPEPDGKASWRRYTAAEFYEATMRGLRP